MNFDLSDEQCMLRDAAERFIQERYALEQRRALIASGQGWSPAIWRDFAEFGWLGLSIAEAQGGVGCTSIESAVLMEQLGAGFVIEPVVPFTVASPAVLARAGAGAQSETLLARTAAGDTCVALACEEPGWRCPDTPQTRALLRAGGYEITGIKSMVQGIGMADLAIVWASLEEEGGQTGPALFLVDARTPGVAVHAYPLLDGRACGDLQLDAVRCEASALLASGAAAQDVLHEALDRARVASLAQALGGMETCMRITAEYLRSRVQFGQPIGKFQSLQHAMAEMFVDVQDARSQLYRALSHLDAEAMLRRRAVASAQLMIGAAGRRVSATGLQLHGGYGLTDEYAVSHAFRQQLVLEKLWGDADDVFARMRP